MFAFLVGCGGSERREERRNNDQPGLVALTWPLTGLDDYPEDDTRQAVTVKIEDTESGRPQLGIGDADIVIQEMVEGGLTRLAVMFHTHYPDVAGPVRSMRETDIGLVLPTSGTLAASGGSGSTIEAIEEAGISTAVEGDPGFSRDDERVSPYNVMLDVSELGDALPPSPPPGPYLPFGDVPADAAGSAAESIALEWPSSSASFDYDDSDAEWIRSDLEDSSGFAFTNVVALYVPVSYDGSTDAAGTPVPTLETTGSGEGFVATGGRSYEVRWSKASDSAAWKLSFGEAEEFTFPPGRTWLALLPDEGGTVAFTRPEGSSSPPP